ncbi:MAG: flagellar motor switch phosphatase FliY [Candidatus Sericytochromatia bacterium]|nr:flagellar motor switch phosphatase FliY [Candidatus Sericytochromatia bacterium]
MALSQEQINAILEGTGTYDAAPAAAQAAAPTAGHGLSDSEKQFFQHFSQTAMEAGAVAVSQALGKNVSIGHPELSVVQAAELAAELGQPQVLIQTGYLTEKTHPSILLLKDYDVAVIFDILMGKDGRNPDLEMGDLQISAIGEVVNQLVGAAATALSKTFERKLAMVPPESELLSMSPLVLPASYQQGALLQVRYQMAIEDVLDGELFELRPLSEAQALYQQLTGAARPAPAAGSTASPPSAQASVSGAPVPPSAAVPDVPPAPTVQPVAFAPLSPAPSVTTANPNLERILDIPLRVTVELGAARLKVKNVLDLTKGSIVELDKLSGENVDLLVNGRLMAKGEVVVINENFGVRITEILGPADRLQNFSGL